MKTEYQFIRFDEQEKLENHKTRWWIIHNKKSGDALGIICWENGWRKYVLQADQNIIFDIKCLEDIIAFIKEAMADHEKELQARKVTI